MKDILYVPIQQRESILLLFTNQVIYKKIKGSLALFFSSFLELD